MVKDSGEVICDICNKTCLVAIGSDTNDRSIHYYNNVEGMLNFKGCYGSKYDLEHFRCDMCESCYEKVAEFIKSIGGRVRQCEYALCNG